MLNVFDHSAYDAPENAELPDTTLRRT
jgi:hypothetical protein